MTSNESQFSTEWTFTRPSFTHTHTRRYDCDSPASWPWASVFALQQSLVKDRVMIVSQKEVVFLFSQKSAQSGLLDEWTCLWPLHTLDGLFVVSSLLQRWDCNYCRYHRQVHHRCGDEAWNYHLLGWISSRWLNNFYYCVWRRLQCPHKENMLSLHLMYIVFYWTHAVGLFLGFYYIYLINSMVFCVFYEHVCLWPGS